jgi:hypothetical protein
MEIPLKLVIFIFNIITLRENCKELFHSWLGKQRLFSYSFAADINVNDLSKLIFQVKLTNHIHTCDSPVMEISLSGELRKIILCLKLRKRKTQHFAIAHGLRSS